jgi:hypothetical protein
LSELYALNGNNQTVVDEWSGYGSEKLLLRPTYWTDTRVEKQLRFAEPMGKISLIPGSITERANDSTLLDGYEFVNDPGKYLRNIIIFSAFLTTFFPVRNETEFVTLPLLRPVVRVTLQELIPQYAGETAVPISLC